MPLFQSALPLPPVHVIFMLEQSNLISQLLDPLLSEGVHAENYALVLARSLADREVCPGRDAIIVGSGHLQPQRRLS